MARIVRDGLTPRVSAVTLAASLFGMMDERAKSHVQLHGQRPLQKSVAVKFDWMMVQGRVHLIDRAGVLLGNGMDARVVELAMIHGRKLTVGQAPSREEKAPGQKKGMSSQSETKANKEMKEQGREGRTNAPGTEDRNRAEGQKSQTTVILVHDEIVVVDPRTSEIVAVLPA